MALRDAFRSVNRTQAPFGLGGGTFDQGFNPTEPGNEDFTLAGDPRSQAQYPAAAAEKGLYESQVRAENQLGAAVSAGLDPNAPQYDPLTEVAEQGFKTRALTFGESLIGWVDGLRQASNLLQQDLVGGEAEEGFRNPNFSDYWKVAWGGVKDADGVTLATGINPQSGSDVLDLFGWEEETTLGGRIGRGIADFGLQIVTDPLTYLTFGMSALGKTVAKATGTKFMDDVVAKLLPAFDGAGNFKLSESYLSKLQASDTYTYNLARELMNDTGDGFVSQFRDDILAKIDSHGGVMPNDIRDALKRRIGDDNKWMDNIVELAIANRVTNDVIKPLVGRDFANIDKAALAILPKWASGGARVSVPFTRSTLESGWLIPGSQGLGRKIVGDPLRKLNGRLKGNELYDVVTNNADEAMNFLATERSLNQALSSGRMKGWQYALARPGLDEMANQATRETIIASMNQLGKRVVVAAANAGVDPNEVWPKVMHLLDGYDASADDMMLGALDDLTGGALRGAAGPATPAAKGRVTSQRNASNGSVFNLKFHSMNGQEFHVDDVVMTGNVQGKFTVDLKDGTKLDVDSETARQIASTQEELYSRSEELFEADPIALAQRGGAVSDISANELFAPELAAGSPQAASDYADEILKDSNLDGAINNLATFIRGTFDEYHSKLSGFDPELKARYIDDYAPHALSTSGNKIMSLLSRLGKGIPKAEWQKLQKEGNPGGVLVAHMINAVGKGGRLEASAGGSAYFNPRSEGRVAAILLSDKGVASLRKDFWQGLKGDGADIIGEGGIVNQVMKTKYAPSSQMNEWMKPVIEKLARDNNITLPKDWDGKIFSEDPLEMAIAYVRNLDEVIRMYNVIDGFKAAGLVFKHDQAPDVFQIMNNMYANAIRQSEKVLEPTAPGVADGLGPQYHGSRGIMPENLEAIEAGRSDGYGNLFGPALYTTDTRDVAQSYRPQAQGAGVEALTESQRVGGKLNAVEWRGDKPPKLVDMDVGEVGPEFRAALKKFADLIEPDVQKIVEKRGKGQGIDELQKTLTELGDADGEALNFYQAIRAWGNGEDAALKGAFAYNIVEDYIKATSVRPGDLQKTFNIMLRDSGVDGMLYEGGARTRNMAHKPIAWLNMEKLKPMDITDLPETIERRVLKGYGDVMGAVPVSVTGPLTKHGWDARDMAGNSRIYQMAKMSEEDFLALRENPMKADGALVDKATSGFQNIRRISGDMSLNVISKAKRGWSETKVGERTVHTVRDKVGKPRADIVVGRNAEGQLEVDFTVNPNLSPRQKIAVTRDLMEKFDEMIITGPLKGEFTHTNLERMITKGSVSDAGARVMQKFMKAKLNQLPDRALEEIAKEPSEFVNTRMLADEFTDEFNLFFKEYAQLYDLDSGKLILDPNRVKLAGDDVIRARISGLRKAARQADEAGWDTASKIMNGIDDTMGLSEVDDFVNPARFAMGGPALEGLSVQRDMAMWLRNYARNTASAYTPEGISALNMASKTSLRWWKAMATIARPTFHIRNHISATWANLTIGVTPADYTLVRDNAITFKKGLREGLDPDEAIAKLSPRARPYFKAAWDNDIMSGFVSTELRGLTTKAEKLSWARIHDVDNFAISKLGGHVMESIEDFHRMAAFVRWYDPADPSSAGVAKAMVERVHFNYANTTPLEDRIKTFVPFFVWTRRNIPLQIANMVENPRIIQRYRAMMQSLDDNFSEDDNGMPVGDQFGAYAAGTDYYVNKGTPFWARMMIDPDLPVKDLLALPNLSVPELMEFGNGLLGPHLSSIINLNEEREFGDVNAPAPLNAILKSLAFVGLYDETSDGDVRMSYWARTLAETALPPTRELIDPLTGGPTDPNRQNRLGIAEDDGFLESSLKTLAGTVGRGFGIKMNTPADVRGVNTRTQEELNELIEQLRLQGQLPPSAEESNGQADLISQVFGGGG